MFEIFISLISNYLQSEELKIAKKEIKSKAISSLHRALRATVNHIKKTRIGEFGDDDFTDKESAELADLWSSAARDVRPIDSVLASTLEAKSGYWTSPSGFVQDLREQGRIFEDKFRLHSVIRELDKLEREF
jgi:hypothetical protein